MSNTPQKYPCSYARLQFAVCSPRRALCQYMHRKSMMLQPQNENGAVAPVVRGGDSPHAIDTAKTNRWLGTKALAFLSLWYLASLVTLFMNKYILSTLKGNPQTLAVAQMTTTCVMGAGKVRSSLRLKILRIAGAPTSSLNSYLCNLYYFAIQLLTACLIFCWAPCNAWAECCFKSYVSIFRCYAFNYHTPVLQKILFIHMANQFGCCRCMVGV